MKTKILATLLFLLAFSSPAAIIFFTDKPNSTPFDSDFFALQRNRDYVNSSVGQMKTWFWTSPSFTGNGSISGTWSVGGSASVGGTLNVGGAVINGTIYYGDGSGLSNVAQQVYLKNKNDNGTNETFWGTTGFDVISANLAYFTNLFTFITNAQYLATDSNGKPISGTGNFSGTNVINVITNNTFVNTNTFISTSNAFFNNTYVTNEFATNVYAYTNFSTNLFFISGKGNTLVITNIFVAVPGSLQNSNTANNSAVITDGTHAYTNAVNAHGVFTNSATGPPSFGLLQNTELVNSSLTIAGTANQVSVSGGGPVALGGTATLSLPSPTIFPGKIAVTGITNTGETSMQGVETNTTMGTGLVHSDNNGKRSSSLLVAADVTAGISPTLNLVNSTNLIYRYTTNAMTGIVLTFGQAFFTNVSTANITVTAINAQDLAAYETCVMWCTNSSGTSWTVTLPNGIGSPGLGLPPVITVTNKQSCQIYIEHYGNQATNAWFKAIY